MEAARFAEALGSSANHADLTAPPTMSNRYRARLVTNSQPITDTPVPTWTPNGFRLTDHPTPSIRSSYSHYDAYRTREPTHPALQQTGSYRIDHAIQLDSTVHNTTFVSVEACVLPHQLDPLGLFGPYGTGGVNASPNAPRSPSSRRGTAGRVAEGRRSPVV